MVWVCSHECEIGRSLMGFYNTRETGNEQQPLLLYLVLVGSAKGKGNGVKGS
jgi:hypothetical protein